MTTPWRLGALMCEELTLLSIVLMLRFTFCHAWLPDTSSKLTNDFGQIASTKFMGNATFPDHFIVLNQDETSILLGGRNRVYNLSTYDLNEFKESRIEWPSSEAHSQLCSLKGKSEDDCQNYVRILVPSAGGKLLVCGTNSYKPLCRHYVMSEVRRLYNPRPSNISRVFPERQVPDREGNRRCWCVPFQSGTQQHRDLQQRTAVLSDRCGLFRDGPADLQGSAAHGTFRSQTTQRAQLR